MESTARPLRRLQEETAWFARAHEVRLLHVVTDATLRGAAVDLVMGFENHADNRGLFFRLEDSVEGVDRGWNTRVRRLLDQLAEKAVAIAPAGIHLRPLGEVSDHGRGTSAEFGATLFQMAGVLVPPLTQVVVVLAPARIEAPALFAREMSALIGSPKLAHVRWVVVEADGAALGGLAREMGAAALACSCVVDDACQQDDLLAMGAASATDEPPPSPPPAGRRVNRWRAPGAMPDVQPPVRIGQPSPPTDPELVAAGLSPMFVNGGGEWLKRLVMGGALAMRQGKIADALTLQARAATLCAEMGMTREQIINLHVLGGYLLAGSLRARARETYVKAGELARVNGLVDAEAQSELALGMMEMVDGRGAQAAAHYAAAGRLAETAKVEPLAIECWRMAGQLAFDSKLEASAVECWKRALEVAGEMAPAVAKMTSAPEVARALAAVCRKRGLPAQAQFLEQQSVELDEGTERSTAPDPASSATVTAKAAVPVVVESRR